jgi:SPP1 gp7 family putative phage head morphogenesis protein
MSYWQDRVANNQNKISSKTAKQIEAQMKKYYATTMKKVIADFEATYDKVQNAIEDDKEPTPADLYNLSKYWEMQAQMQKELQKLGDKQVTALGKAFETNFFEVYYSIALPSSEMFSTLDSDMVKQMINNIWVADGKSWSQRIWDNTKLLAETLNEELINCVTTGAKTSALKQKLQERFNVSYGRADALARTELAHIQTQAAQQRYKDYGIKQVEVWADEDERRCDVCGKLHQKKFPADAQPPIPAHPRCRCCILPVIDNESEEITMDNNTVQNNDAMEKQHKKYIDMLKKQGISEEGAEILWNADESFWDKYNGYLFDQQYNKFGGHPHQNMVNEYTRKHPETKDKFRGISYGDAVSQFFVCVDCGEVVHKEHTKDNAQKRCPECQEKYRKKYKAQKERERRARQKNNG